MTDAQIKDALQECNNAPINIPQSLQSYGAVFGIDIKSGVVAFCSDNIFKYLPLRCDEVLKSTLESFFGAESANILSRCRQMKNNTYTSEFVEICGKLMFVRLVKWNQFVMFEMQDEEISFDANEHLKFLDTTSGVLQYANSTEELFSLYLDAVREYTGYDRVMLYKFDARYDGEVIAESRQEYLGSFLGHRFPATDIPQSARDMYVKNPVRFIEDVEAAISRLVFKVPEYENLVVDLSYINSRAVAPVHLEYLRNMSVRSSMSISITDESGKLWGLIACHNNSPKYVPLQKRLYCEQSSKMLSMVISSREKADKNYKLAVRQAALTELVTICANGFENLIRLNESELQKLLLELVKADGVAISSPKKMIKLGITPESNTILEIINLLSYDPTSPIAKTDSLASLNKKYERLRTKASGVLLLKVSDLQHIVWFRSEVQKAIAWAGQPIKKFYDDNGTLRLSPRKSFETWYEERFLTCDEWSDEDVYFANTFAKSLLKSKLIGYDDVQNLQVAALADKVFQVFDIMPQGVIMTDLDGVINYTNKAFEKLSGYKADEALGKYPNILSSGKHDRSFYADIWTTILGMKVWRGKIINARPDGELYKVDATIAPIVSQKGDIVGFIGIEHEITELANKIEHEMQEKEALLESIKEFQKSSSITNSIEMANIKYQTKKELLSQIAHNWRNPLSVISLYIQDLVFAYESGELNEEYMQEFQTKCMDAIDDITRVITNFSNYFRPEGKEELFNPADAILETLEALGSYINDKNINVRFEDDNSEHLIYGLKSALNAVILEILNNVADIMEARALMSADVWIGLYGEQESVVIEISDNCGGIEELDKAFEPYYTTKGVASGIGLGLFEVKILVEKYLKGSISVSNGTLGAKFVIKLGAKVGSDGV